MEESLIKFCIENNLPFVIEFPNPWYEDYDSWLKEYNSDTSAPHLK